MVRLRVSGMATTWNESVVLAVIVRQTPSTAIEAPIGF